MYRGSDPLDGLGGSGNELVVEQFMIHGKTDRGDKGEPLVSLSVVHQPSRVSQSDRVCHVNGDGVTVSERDSRGEFESRRPSVTERDDSVQTQLVQVGRFQL